MLLLHDHGSAFAIGKEKVITPWDDPARAAEAAAWQERLYDGVSLGEALVARGFAVLAADALGWGSRQGNGYEAQQALAANLMQFGLTLAGVIAAEDAQLARWLARHPAVDARRVGVLGFSFGGYRAWQAAALCPEVAAGVAASWMGRLGDLMRPGGNQLRGQSAFAMLHPALGGRLDYPDVAGLAAPRPMLFLSGRHDRHFPADGGRSGVRRPAADLAGGRRGIGARHRDHRRCPCLHAGAAGARRRVSRAVAGGGGDSRLKENGGDGGCKQRDTASTAPFARAKRQNE